MKRRNFLGSLIALPLAAQPIHALANQSQHEWPTSPAALHLDPATASMIIKRINAGHPDYDNDVLDLSTYRTASAGAIRMLASFDFDFVDIGLAALTTEIALALANWNSYFLIFSNLRSIPIGAAKALAHGDAAHALVFEKLAHLEGEAAEHLVSATGQCSPLSIGLTCDLSPQLASALAGHKHELSLKLIEGQLKPSAARELSLHRGYHLEIATQSAPSNDALDQLAFNPTKGLSTHLDESVGRRWVTTLAEDMSAWMQAEGQPQSN